MKFIQTKKHLYGRFRNLKRFTDKQKKDFKKYLLDTILIRIRPTIRNKHIGIKINISQSGIKHSLSVGSNITKMKSVTAIDEILQTAFLMDVKKDKHKHTLSHFVFRNIVNIDGELFFITLNVKEDNQGNYYYHHYLTDIKKAQHTGNKLPVNR